MTRTLSAVRAVRRDLRELEQHKPGISKCGLAAAALAMARELDDPENTASGMASCARVLDSLMAELTLLARRRAAPAAPGQSPDPDDGIDQLAKRRATRRSGP